MSDEVTPATTVAQLVPTYTVGAIDYDSSLDEDLFINRNDLSAEFARHAERYGWYSTCFELASVQVDQSKTQLARLYALLDHEKRMELMNAGVKTTEKMIENSVITDDRYVAMQEELLTAQMHQGVLKAAMHSMQHRKDMLVQLGAASRAELQSDISMSIKAQHAKG